MLNYRSGESIRKGDRIRFHGNAAEIELVADPETADPESEWYVKEFGGGVLIVDPSVSGHTFIGKNSLSSYEDLEFVARAED
jgi:hypothetical protein